MRRRSVLAAARLGLFAGAFFCCASALSGQVVPPPASDVPIPPKPETDTTLRRDTLVAAFGSAPQVRTVDIGPQYAWDREELFASGAFSLADLLQRIPGVTGFRSGGMAAAKFSAFNGDVGRVRVFLDDVEFDNLDPRTGGPLDLALIPLWALERVAVERLGAELRVHATSWSVESTSPYTRTDVYTGDEQTNVFRGFYGKRFWNGAGVQFAGQQTGTTPPQLGGGGDALSLMGRFGLARSGWSIDAFGYRSNASRTIQTTFGSGLSVPPYEAVNSLIYLRAAFGRVDAGPWGHVIASNRRMAESTPHQPAGTALSRRILADTADTTASLSQYVLAAGWSRGALRLSGADRIRAGSGASSHALSARAELTSSVAALSGFLERDDFSGINRADGAVRFTPLPILALAAGVTRLSAIESSSSALPPTLAYRAEAAVRLLRPWLSVGYLSRDTALLSPLRLYDTAYAAVAEGTSSAVYLTLRGDLIGPIGVDVAVTRWSSPGFLRPELQARSELNLVTSWLSRFPSGNFGVKAAVIHEHRGSILFPTGAGLRATESASLLSGQLEVRILRGVLTYQISNMFGSLHQIIPDFFMARAVNYYGIRWEFWD